jgi:hypothetical protein
MFILEREHEPLEPTKVEAAFGPDIDYAMLVKL